MEISSTSVFSGRISGSFSDRFAGFSVLDAVGIRMGTVTDTFLDGDGKAVFVRVALGHVAPGPGAALDNPPLLIAAHYVTLVDRQRRKIQVRSIRRFNAREQCPVWDAGSAAAESLAALFGAHPPTNAILND